MPTKYTNSNKGTSTTDIDKSTEERNWSKTGIKRFNRLRQMIIADRKENPDFIVRWVQEERVKHKIGMPKGNDNDDDSVDSVDADDDLFSDLNLPTASLTPAKISVGVADTNSDNDDEDEEEEDDNDSNDDNDSSDDDGGSIPSKHPV